MDCLKDMAEENVQIVPSSILAVITKSSSVNGRHGIDNLFAYTGTASVMAT